MTPMSRKEFLKTTGLTSAGLTLSAYSFATNTNKAKIKAIAFDGFPVFDPRPVFKKVSELSPDKGKQLTEIFKAKQFTYQWLRVTGNRYKNFLEIAKDALVYAASECGLTLSETDIVTVMNEYKAINTWPDVKDALNELKKMKLKLSFVSNLTAEMIQQGLQNSGTGEYFDHILSSDSIKTYKPSAAAYQMGINALSLKKEEILFAAFAGWDMAGAKWFGYPTFWVNRLNAPIEQLDAVPDGTGTSLIELVSFVKNYNS